MSIKDQIKNFISENFVTADVSLIDDTESLLDAGIIDSTSILELISFIEEEFGIAVEDDEIIPENFDSLAAIDQYIKRKLESEE